MVVVDVHTDMLTREHLNFLTEQGGLPVSCECAVVRRGCKKQGWKCQGNFGHLSRVSKWPK